jgi:hypothetical protein
MTDRSQNQEAAMQRKEVLVIRIGVSLEGITQVEQQEASDPVKPGSSSPEAQTSSADADLPSRPPRFRGRDNDPNQARTGDRRAMSDAQRRILFRLAYSLGDRDGALDRVLEALGVGRLEWATRVDASRAIDALKAQTTRDRPTNGGRHA